MTKRRRHNVLIVTACALTALALSGCGFSPVHGINRTAPVGTEEKLAQVSIENIPDREGQYLRNALIDRFYRTDLPADPRWRLIVSRPTESLTDLDVTKTSDATRGQLRLDAEMKLVEISNGEEVLTRSLRSITSYNILGSEFATRVTEENARQNALNDLARQIELQLNLYFKR